jgi:membrane-bound serine protease (ClpP class)
MAVAQTDLNPLGRVLVRGELWRAKLTSSEAAIPAGSRVRVLRAEGHTLEVTAIVRAQDEV